MQNIPSHNTEIRQMFVAKNKEYDVFSDNNKFIVNRFTEVETKDGWKFSDKLVKGDLLVVEENKFVRVDSIYVDVNRVEIFWSDYS